MPRMLFAGFLIAIVTLVGCAGINRDRTPSVPTDQQSCCQKGEASPHRAAIVRTATRLLGASTIEVNGRRIAYDCAGVTRAIFLEHGIDLYDSNARDPKANGVRLIYAHVRQHGTFHQGPMVDPGDLVFFDNTWDYNGDGKVNDPLTHVGIVERQEQDGTVVFISRVSGAVERYHMNLAFPHVHKTDDGKILNDYLRRKDTLNPANTGYLTGELFAQFATRVER
ncbi:MAG: NlpC/P60 family protein [Nitrospirae bacterium]|nr:NlpC/P60 family protein [Nitrospirota bacterium]